MGKPTEEGTPEKEFMFWTKQFSEQVQYIDKLFDRLKSEEIDLSQFMTMAETAFERLRYISKQRLWIIEEIAKEIRDRESRQ